MWCSVYCISKALGLMRLPCVADGLVSSAQTAWRQACRLTWTRRASLGWALLCQHRTRVCSSAAPSKGTRQSRSQLASTPSATAPSTPRDSGPTERQVVNQTLWAMFKANCTHWICYFHGTIFDVLFVLLCKCIYVICKWQWIADAKGDPDDKRKNKSQLQIAKRWSSLMTTGWFWYFMMDGYSRTLSRVATPLRAAQQTHGATSTLTCPHVPTLHCPSPLSGRGRRHHPWRVPAACPTPAEPRPAWEMANSFYDSCRQRWRGWRAGARQWRERQRRTSCQRKVSWEERDKVSWEVHSPDAKQMCIFFFL